MWYVGESGLAPAEPNAVVATFAALQSAGHRVTGVTSHW
jgi:hypothetical protein